MMVQSSEVTMFNAVAEVVSAQQGDSAEFMEKAQAIAIGVARDYAPVRLYVVRIDNWFGPKWMHFAGKFTAGSRLRGFPTAAIGVHKTRLHVPPFVPSRVVTQRVFVGPDYEETAAAAPLHIECSSKQALSRRIADIDEGAAFLWFSGESEPQKRGSVMIYLPVAFDATAARRGNLRDCGAFYMGFSQRGGGWEPAMLRGISRAEVSHLEESGRAFIDNEPLGRWPTHRFCPR
jgi:hypothetical protein